MRFVSRAIGEFLRRLCLHDEVELDNAVYLCCVQGESLEVFPHQYLQVGRVLKLVDEELSESSNGTITIT